MGMPNDETTGKAVAYMAETDLEFGQLHSNKDAAEYLLKANRARLGLESGAKSAAAQEAQALASDEYANLVEDLRELSAEYYGMEAKRKTAALIIDVWRTTAANSRKGNI